MPNAHADRGKFLLSFPPVMERGLGNSKSKLHSPNTGWLTGTGVEYLIHHSFRREGYDIVEYPPKERQSPLTAAPDVVLLEALNTLASVDDAKTPETLLAAIRSTTSETSKRITKAHRRLTALLQDPDTAETPIFILPCCHNSHWILMIASESLGTLVLDPLSHVESPINPTSKTITANRIYLAQVTSPHVSSSDARFLFTSIQRKATDIPSRQTGAPGLWSCGYTVAFLAAHWGIILSTVPTGIPELQALLDSTSVDVRVTGSGFIKVTNKDLPTLSQVAKLRFHTVGELFSTRAVLMGLRNPQGCLRAVRFWLACQQSPDLSVGLIFGTANLSGKAMRTGVLDLFSTMFCLSYRDIMAPKDEFEERRNRQLNIALQQMEEARNYELRATRLFLGSFMSKHSTPDTWFMTVAEEFYIMELCARRHVNGVSPLVIKTTPQKFKTELSDCQMVLAAADTAINRDNVFKDIEVFKDMWESHRSKINQRIRTLNRREYVIIRDEHNENATIGIFVKKYKDRNASQEYLKVAKIFEVPSLISDKHIELNHAHATKTFKALQQEYSNITREMCELMILLCECSI